MRKPRMLLLILALMLLSVSIQPLARAETTVNRVAPYDYGQVCQRSDTSERCWTVPPFRSPQNRMSPKGDNFYYESAGMAHSGQLRIDNFHPTKGVSQDPYYAAPGNSIYKSTAAVWVTAPSTTSPITVNAEIEGIDLPVPESSSFLLCLQILEWDNVAGQDCMGDYEEIRDLQAQATLQPGNNYRILVFLYDYWGNHIAAAKVNRISYTIQ